jgi:hypothetical protein
MVFERALPRAAIGAPRGMGANRVSER